MSRVRLFISTDMQMITGVNNIDGDKDDVQSLVHALMYQDKLDIVGISSSTSWHQPGKNDERFIHHVIDKYAQDQAKLASHGERGDFKTADQLHAITYQGTKTLADGSKLPPANEASRAIIREAREAAEAGEPLWIAAWGGLGDVARALKDAPDIADDIRLFSIASKLQEPDATVWLRENFSGKGDLWWIDSENAFRGVYASPEGRMPLKMDLKFVEKLAKDHGALGDFLYENSKDVHGTNDNQNGLKMGDSSSIFYLIDKSDNNNPLAESWGGEYRKVGDKYWKDSTAASDSFSWSGGQGARTIYEDRAAWTKDFAHRFDWLKGDVQEEEEEGDVSEPLAGTGDLRITVSGDRYDGDPKFEVRVDGKKVGTYTTTADHDEDEWQTIVIDGGWADGVDHKVEVTFLNDEWGGSASKDRNLWIEDVSLNGVTVGEETVLSRSGSSVTWTLDDTPEDVITVRASGDHWKGDPNFVLLVDGKVIDATNRVTADKRDGEWQTFTFTGDFGLDDGEHTVAIRYDNDRWDRDAGQGRNLYIDQVSVNGVVNGMDGVFEKNGTKEWDFLF